MKHIEEKQKGLLSYLEGFEKLAVAFSGGVDSSFLLYMAQKALPGRVLAVTVVSPLFAKWEREDARAFAQTLGIEQLVIRTNPLENPNIAANPKDRCYHCKKQLFGEIIRAAKAQGYTTVADGSNMDDLDDYRPGAKAVRELGIISPLQACGLFKRDIRCLSKQMGLDIFDKPSYACLASRIPYGEALSEQKLEQIEQAEVFLHGLGFYDVRVRHHGQLARIEAAQGQLDALLAHAGQVVAYLKQLGYIYVTLDLGGYRMGSLNETTKE
ncbi:MAG: ATP-dependent sacrificial sulfur transferase LarE [Christensenellales bacterium]|jgi:uncharacterized protein